MSDVAYGCIGFGVLLLIGGFFAYFYEYTWWGLSIGIRPYADLGILLMGFGFVLIVVGVVLLGMKKPQPEGTERRVVLVPLKKCPKCGIKYRGYEYCPTCGMKLEPIR